MNRISILGAGAWGTALAVVANRAGSQVTLWSRNRNILGSVRERRMNDVYLPGIFLDPAIAVTEDLREACRADILLLAIPSQQVRALCITVSDVLAANVPIMVCAKGIERGSLALMTDVITGILTQNPVAVLSGPNFATEAAQGMPAATVIASSNEMLAETLQYALGGKLFRPYLTNDMIGAQITGAAKNVVAIACGIAVGRNLGENARAALITRGLAEIGRLAVARGGRYDTLMGLAGLGDLVLTCSSERSRNFRLGLALATGLGMEDAQTTIRGVTEGVDTAESITALAHKSGVEMPISEAVRDILRQSITVERAIDTLLERPMQSNDHWDWHHAAMSIQ